MAAFKQDDLLNTLGAKTKGEGSSPAPTAQPTPAASTPVGSGSPTDNLPRGESLLEMDSNVVSSATEDQGVSAKKDTVVSDPNSWTLESALKEVKKLREENKATRVKYQEQVQVIKSEMDTKTDAIKNEYKEALEAKKELEALKAHEMDKKRDLSEKLAHRETLISQLQAEKDRLSKESENKLIELQAKLGQLEAERQAQMEVYKHRLDSELNRIPEQYREFAQKMVQGYGDPREALVALTEATIKGLFEEKKVIVNHSVPNATNGARASKQQLDAAAEEVKKNMSSSDLIKAGLNAIRSGQPNSAFRSK